MDPTHSKGRWNASKRESIASLGRLCTVCAEERREAFLAPCEGSRTWRPRSRSVHPPTRTRASVAVSLRSTSGFRSSSFPLASEGVSPLATFACLHRYPSIRSPWIGRRVRLSNRSMGSLLHVKGKSHLRRTVRRCIRHHHRHLRDDGERHACARVDGVRATKGKQGNVRNDKNEEERNRNQGSESRRWRGGRREEEEPRRPLQRPRECECKRRRNPSPSRWSNDRMTQGN